MSSSAATTQPKQACSPTTSSCQGFNLKKEFLSCATSFRAEKSALPWCFRVFPEAPNPGLHVDGVGVLGVPLDAQEASVVWETVNASKHLPSGTTAPTSWTRDAPQFRFDNPGWDTFLSQVSQWACAALGVGDSNAAQLANGTLRWHGIGSAADASYNSISQAAAEQTKLGSVLVLLPSLFGGGSTRLQHGGHTETFHLDKLVSAGDVAILAWRTESTFVSEPLSQGSYLALAFDLVGAPRSSTLAPTLRSADLARLGQLLDAWQRGRRAAFPSKLVYLLNHKYSQADVRSGILHGCDAQLAAALETCAPVYGFKLGLSVLTCRLKWYGPRTRAHRDSLSTDSESVVYDDDAPIKAEDSESEDVGGVVFADDGESEDRKPSISPNEPHPSSNAGPLPSGTATWSGHTYNYDSDDGKPFKPSPPSVDGSDSDGGYPSRFSSPGYCPIHSKPRGSKPPRRIGPLVDFSGNLVRDKLDYDSGKEIIPTALHDTLIASPNARLQWDLGSWDRHLLLVIWPSWADFDVAQGRKAFPEACARLRASSSIHPTPEEHELVDLVATRATPESTCEVIDAVCNAARRWKDPEIWLRAVRLCDADRSIATLDPENTQGALDVFGFEAVRPTLEDALRRDPSDVAALQFLHAFAASNVASGQWVSDQTSLRLKGVKAQIDAFLARPDETSPEAMVAIVQSAILGGQPSLILSDMVPNLYALPIPSHILRTLIDELRTHGKALDPEGEALRDIVPRLLHKFVTALDLENVPSTECVATILDAIKYCLAAGNTDACTVLLARVVTPDWAITEIVEYVKDTLAPLLTRLPSLLTRKRQSLSSAAFAPAIRAILLQWANTVMGPRPTETETALAKLNQLEKWTCTCDPCVEVRAFLQDQPESEKVWERIGGTKRKHVEKFLKANAVGIAAFEAIMTRPQGLKVFKDEAVNGPVRWTAYQGRGVRLLRSVSSDPDTLVTILGPDGPAVASLLSGKTIPTESLLEALTALLASDPHARELSPISVDDSDAEPASLPPSPAPPSTSGGRRTGSVVSYASIPTRSRSPTRASSPSESERPTKRPRTAYDPEDVIDLT